MAETAKKKILIVDDEPDVSLFLKTLFEDEGYAAVTAENGRVGFESARKNNPDMITLDVTMPEESGVRMYRDLKDDEVLKKIPVIIITGLGEPMKNFISTRRQVPAPEGFISKPIDKDELLKAAREILARPKS